MKIDENRKKILSYNLLLFIAIIIPMIVGVTYGYFLVDIKGNKTYIRGTSASDFSFSLSSSTNGLMSIDNLIPKQTSNSLSSIDVGGQIEGTTEAKSTFTISTIPTKKDEKTYPVNYNLFLTNIKISEGLVQAAENGSLKWMLMCKSCGNTSKDFFGDFKELNASNATTSYTNSEGIKVYEFEKIYLTNTSELVVCANSKDEYELSIWIDWLESEDQSYVLNQIMDVKIGATGEYIFTEGNSKCGA